MVWAASASSSTSRDGRNQSVHRRAHDRAVRLDFQEQRVRGVLDNQGRNAAPRTQREHHQHRVVAGLQPITEPARPRADQGGGRELHEGTGEADGKAGHSSQRRSARTVLDAAPSHWRPAARQASTVRCRYAVRPPRSAGDRATLRSAGIAGVELRDWPGGRRVRRARPAVIADARQQR